LHCHTLRVCHLERRGTEHVARLEQDWFNWGRQNSSAAISGTRMHVRDCPGNALQTLSALS